MQKKFNIMVLAKQVVFSFLSLIIIYISYALYFFKGDTNEYLDFVLNIPAISWIFCLMTFIICLLIGLPIRLNRSVNIWWRNKKSVPIILILLGFISIGFSLYPPFLNQIELVNGNLITIKLQGNSILTLIGSFLIPFAILHAYPQKGK